MLNVPVEITNLLKSNTTKKNIRVHFPNGEHPDITNENIVSESVSFTESVCSQNELKFGLCESPIIEFETYGVGKIKDAIIECSLEVEYQDYQYESDHITIGYDMTIIEGNDFKPKIKNGATLTIITAQPISNATLTFNGQTQTLQHNYASLSLTWDSEYNGDYSDPFNIKYPADITLNFTRNCEYIYFQYTAEEKTSKMYSIPLGTFYVDSCKKQADMTHRRIIGYSQFNKFEWNDYPFVPLEFESNFVWKNANLKLSSDGLMSIYKLPNERMATKFRTNRQASSMIPFTFNGVDYQYQYVVDTYRFTPDDSKNAYAIKVTNDKDFDSVIKTNPIMSHVAKLVSSANRMFVTYGEITFVNSSGTEYGTITGGGKNIHIDTLNKGVVLPYVSISESSYERKMWDGYLTLVQYISVWSGDGKTMIVDGTAENGSVYYKELSAVISSSGDIVPRTTAKKTYQMESASGSKVSKDLYVYDFTNLLNKGLRDIIQGYCELKGVFGRSKRNGKFDTFALKDRFKTLYPSETLYPSDTLYPRDNEGMEVYRQNYKTLWYDDDEVKPYGAVSCNFVKDNETKQLIAYCEGYDKTTDIGTYLTYDISSNSLIAITNKTESEIIVILEEIAKNIGGITYMPSEIEMIGRPDLESGDILSIKTTEGWITTIVKRRVLTGIQSLNDSITSD